MMPTKKYALRLVPNAGQFRAKQRQFLRRAGPRLLHSLILLSILSSLVGVPGGSASAAASFTEQQTGDVQAALPVGQDKIEMNLWSGLILPENIAPFPETSLPQAEKDASLERRSASPFEDDLALEAIGGVYLVTRNELGRSRNFYSSGTNWENVKGSSLPEMGSDAYGIVEFTLDPFTPFSRAWVALDDTQSNGGSVWRTENLHMSPPDWEIILTTEQITQGISLATGGSIHQAYVARILVSPVEESLIYIAVRADEKDLYIGRSTNAGETWNWSGKIGEVNQSGRLFGFQLSNQDPNRLWIGEGTMDDNGPAFIFRSDDGGQTFSSISSTLTNTFGTDLAPYDIHVPESDVSEQIIFTVVKEEDKGNKRHLMRTQDGGETWEEITAEIVTAGITHTYYADISFHAIRTNPYDYQQVFYASTSVCPPSPQTCNKDNWHLLVSNDGGETWSLQTTVNGSQQYRTAAWGNSRYSRDILAARLLKSQVSETYLLPTSWD